VRQLVAASLAAILIIGVLAVISVLLFNRPSKGNEPQPTTHPISITLSRCSSLPWSWQVDLCTHHQFKDLLQWRKMGEYVLVLERAYVDLNQLVMTYRVFSQSTGRQMFAELDDTVITTPQGQSFTPSAGSSVPDGPAVAQFNTPPVPKQTQTLQLHVQVNRLRIMGSQLTVAGTPPVPQFTAVPGPVTFDFALEYHGGLVVTPHQTVTVKGLSVTLERVKISASETIIEGTTKGTFSGFPDRIYNFSLDAAGRSPGNLTPVFGGESNPFSAVAYDELLGQHGTWTFEISETRSKQAWVFHFRVS
jgi:hypothetical protein